MDKVAILGASGPIGRYVGMELYRRGVPFRAVGRTATKLDAAFGGLHAETMAADLSHPGGAAEAMRGADTVIYTLGVAYTEFHIYPKLMRLAVDAASAAGVRRFVLVTGVYSYGVPQTQKVAETHPRTPVSVKGRLRKEQENILMSTGERGIFKTMVVRLPDFYGPHADNSLANPIFRAALAGKTANWLGPVGALHEFVFVPDAGPVIVELAARDRCYGEAWNFAGAGEISGLAFIQKIYQAAGREPKFRSAGRTMLGILGLFNPLMREMPEMLYLQETPVLLDDTKLRRELGEAHKTSYDDGIKLTLEWMRQNPAAPGAAGRRA